MKYWNADIITLMTCKVPDIYKNDVSVLPD